MKRKRRSARSASPPGLHPSPASPRSPTVPLFSGLAPWVLTALVALNIVVYASVAQYDFVTWDDPQYLLDNPHVAGGLTWDGLSWALTSGYASNWHPLTWWSHMLDVQLHGLSAGPHHVTSLLLHITNSVLLFGLLHAMTGAPGRSAFVAALFAVHPLHVESVAWVAERKDVLSTLFWMLTVWAYLRYLRRRRPGRYVAMATLFALGLMAKPMLVTLPFVLLLLDMWPLGRVRAWWPLVREKLPLLALAGASSIITFIIAAWGGTDLIARWRLRPLLLPIAGGLAVAACIIVARDQVEYWRNSLALWGHTVAVTHDNFIAQNGFGEALAGQGKDAEAIAHFAEAVRIKPDFPYAQNNLGVELKRQHHPDEAIPHYSLALRVKPDFAEAHHNLANALDEEGRTGEAITHYIEALRIKPDYADAHNGLGVALAREERLDEAADHLSAAIRIKPDSVDAHNNLGIVLATQGKLDDAIHEFSQALRVSPGNILARRSLEELTGAGKKSP